jgi:undecaprenyl-diphosphatase
MNTLISTLNKKLNKEVFYTLNGLTGKSKLLDRFFIFWARDFIGILLFFSIIVYLLPGLVESIELNRSRIIAIFLITCFSWMLSVLIKYVHFTPRPYTKRDKRQNILLKKSRKSPAFPSGHATILFSIASSLLFFVPSLSVLFFVLAIIISLSRVITGLHWPIDILAGAILGTIVPLIINTIV